MTFHNTLDIFLTEAWYSDYFAQKADLELLFHAFSSHSGRLLPDCNDAEVLYLLRVGAKTFNRYSFCCRTVRKIKNVTIVLALWSSLIFRSSKIFKAFPCLRSACSQKVDGQNMTKPPNVDWHHSTEGTEPQHCVERDPHTLKTTLASAELWLLVSKSYEDLQSIQKRHDSYDWP